jgi:hypothetical protein
LTNKKFQDYKVKENNFPPQNYLPKTNSRKTLKILGLCSIWLLNPFSPTKDLQAQSHIGILVLALLQISPLTKQTISVLSMKTARSRLSLLNTILIIKKTVKCILLRFSIHIPIFQVQSIPKLLKTSKTFQNQAIPKISRIQKTFQNHANVSTTPCLSFAMLKRPFHRINIFIKVTKTHQRKFKTIRPQKKSSAINVFNPWTSIKILLKS